ncbi:5'-nucleotidase [Aulographum hederae CBS 113979]|uniref:5'-nucleotidase n=1 Tax=Aulographum hederae CBS 113979 TaxID=1176131 RepID=A0A6G1H8X5_9PEZI|nr:5'-nucleotidase [Aulographum hederae CBS 113979]
MDASKPTADEVITYSPPDNQTDGPPHLRFLHYNDVYHVDPSSAEPVGGIARFQSLVNYYRSDGRFGYGVKGGESTSDLVTFFSGDAFNPSLESSVTKGSHMVPVLNGIGTDIACVGNHDLDFGVKQFRHLSAQCKFPWLLANVLDPALGKDVPLGNAGKTHVITSSNGIKIGCIGLCEREWLDTINSLPPDLIYKSASQTAKELVPGLRDQGCEIVVATTHQREPNDNKLAEKTPDGLIDIILGGHDHYYNHSLINGTHVLRSGSDFKQLSYIEAWRKPDGSKKWDLKIVRRDVMSQTPQDPETVKLVDKLTASLRTKLEKPIGHTAAPLDARFTTVRLKESNLGNFICDLMRSHYSADCCIMAAGTIRGDQVYPPGILKMKDIMNCFPFEDPVVVLKLKGKAILEAIENSVSKYPALEGRFPQVSKIEFEFDPKAPEGSRVKYAHIGSKPIDLDKEYVLATRGYMARGKDGFDSLLCQSEGGVAEEIVSEENGLLISQLLRQYFLSLQVLSRWKNWSNSLGRHWASVQEDLHQKHPVLEPSSSDKPSYQNVKSKSTEADAVIDDSDDEDATKEQSKEELTGEERRNSIIRKVLKKWRRLAGLRGDGESCDQLQEGEFMVTWTKTIAPRLEGRIKMSAS